MINLNSAEVKSIAMEIAQKARHQLMYGHRAYIYHKDHTDAWMLCGWISNIHTEENDLEVFYDSGAETLSREIIKGADVYKDGVLEEVIARVYEDGYLKDQLRYLGW